jgi:hypothetical protein
MMTEAIRITNVTITPVAFADPPLLNSVGVHEPFALRAVVDGDSSATDRVFSPFEVACLDIQGQAGGRPVADLLGGAVRDEVPFSAYPVLQVGGAPGRRTGRLGRGARPRRHRRPGQAHGR